MRFKPEPIPQPALSPNASSEAPSEEAKNVREDESPQSIPQDDPVDVTSLAPVRIMVTLLQLDTKAKPLVMIIDNSSTVTAEKLIDIDPPEDVPSIATRS
jgi:hypothetical protein